MKLSQIGEVNHGQTLSRITAKPDEEKIEVPLFTIQDLNIENGNLENKLETKTISISKDDFSKEILSKKDMVVIGLTVHKACVISKEHTKKIIPSNFAYVVLNKRKIDPYYFTWYFNEHPQIKKVLQVATQGSSLRALSVQMLRELDIELIDIKSQKKIGQIYHLNLQKERLLKEKLDLEKKLYNNISLNILKGE